MTKQFTDYFVYIICLLDGSPIYIGQGRGTRGGHYQHRNEAVDAIVAAGKTLPLEIIKGDLMRPEALSLEIEMISKYGRIDIGTGILLNRTGGGLGTRDPSPSVMALRNAKRARNRALLVEQKSRRLLQKRYKKVIAYENKECIL